MEKKKILCVTIYRRKKLTKKTIVTNILYVLKKLSEKLRNMEENLILNAISKHIHIRQRAKLFCCENYAIVLFFVKSYKGHTKSFLKTTIKFIIFAINSGSNSKKIV